MHLGRAHKGISVLRLALLGGILPMTGCFNGSISVESISGASLASLVLAAPYSTTSHTFDVGQVISPAPTVSFLDSQGNVLTSHTEKVTLSPYNDATCTTPASSGVDGSASENAIAGVATFSNRTNSHAGKYYFQGSATLSSGEVLKTACSKQQIWLTLPPDHLTVYENNPTVVLNGTAAIELGVIVRDRYENPVVDGLSSSLVNFSGLSPGANASIVVAAAQTDPNRNLAITANPEASPTPSSSPTSSIPGYLSVKINPNNALYPMALYQALLVLPSGSPTPSVPITPVLLALAVKANVNAASGGGNGMYIGDAPTQVFQGESQWLRVAATDQIGTITVGGATGPGGGRPLNTSFTGNLYLSNDNGATTQAVGFTSSDAGMKYAKLGNYWTPATAFAMFPGIYWGYLSNLNLFSQSYVTSEGPVQITNPNFDCGSHTFTPTSPPTASWVGNYWTPYGGQFVPAAGDLVSIPPGFSRSVPASTLVYAGCVRLLAGSTGSPGPQLSLVAGGGSPTALVIDSSELSVANPPSISMGTNTLIKFKRDISNGYGGAQRFIFGPGANLTLENIEVAPQGTWVPLGGAAKDPYAFYINGNGPNGAASSGSFLTLNNLILNPTVGARHYEVHIDTQLSLNSPLNIPPGVEVIVNPGSALYLNDGATINGLLTVRQDAKVYVRADELVTVNSGGRLNLFGTVGQPAQMLATVFPSGRFRIHLGTGASLSVWHGKFSDLGSPTAGASNAGLSLDGATVDAFFDAQFENLDPANYTLEFASTTFTMGYLSGIHFKDPQGLYPNSGKLMHLVHMSSGAILSADFSGPGGAASATSARPRTLEEQGTGMLWGNGIW